MFSKTRTVVSLHTKKKKKKKTCISYTHTSNIQF